MKYITFSALTFLLLCQNSHSANIENGKLKYRANCIVCHGSKGLGDGIAAANLSKQPANILRKMSNKSENLLSDSVMRGKPGMPAFRTQLTPTDATDIFAYIRQINR